MSKEMKSNSLFGTEINGFKKKQVNTYIAELERKQNDSLEECRQQNRLLSERLEASEKQYEELLVKYNELQTEKARFADILINAEKSAEAIRETARKEAEAEKNSLLDETEELRRTIVHRNVVLRDIKISSETMIGEMLRSLSEAGTALETKLREAQERLSMSAAELHEKYSLYSTAEEENAEFTPEDSGGEKPPAGTDPFSSSAQEGENDG